eukprot:TRINITY_DN4776_c0_g1_i1.p1 TRINITY_DN4776_c0_g1~~TRINITY_DN4776_c0_g1_i1.p1  ORF type:complete len:197 (-),score=5.65 TRINITY_DN4776_c0_g1_i1:3-593(-)
MADKSLSTSASNSKKIAEESMSPQVASKVSSLSNKNIKRINNTKGAAKTHQFKQFTSKLSRLEKSKEIPKPKPVPPKLNRNYTKKTLYTFLNPYKFKKYDSISSKLRSNNTSMISKGSSRNIKRKLQVFPLTESIETIHTQDQMSEKKAVSLMRAFQYFLLHSNRAIMTSKSLCAVQFAASASLKTPRTFPPCTLR